jgi:hypothetical protein
MKQLQEKAKNFFEENKFQLINAVERSGDLGERPLPRWFGAIRALAEGGRMYTEALPPGIDNMFVHYNQDPQDAIEKIIDFMNEVAQERNPKDLYQQCRITYTYGKRGEPYFTSRFKLCDMIERDLLPFIEEAEKEEKFPEVKLTEYPPCAFIFRVLYKNARAKEHFVSTGLFSRFVHKCLEMVSRIDTISFEEILKYGVEYPQTRTAKILQQYFKSYWDEANVVRWISKSGIG